MPVPGRERNQPLTQQSSLGRMAAVWAARALVSWMSEQGGSSMGQRFSVMPAPAA